MSVKINPKVAFINPGLANTNPLRGLKIQITKTRPHVGMRSLAAGILKALTPEIDVVYINDNTDDINWDQLVADGVNMVALSVLTHQAPRAYEIAAEARARGMYPVLGGWHPTLMPEEAREHGTVVKGEAYLTWRRLIEDFKALELKDFYEADRFAAPHEIISPDRSIYPGINQQIIATNGCKFHCIFCCMAAFYKGSMTTKQVEQVIQEVEEIGEGFHRFYFDDDNMSAFPEISMEIFSALADLNARRLAAGKKKMGFFAFIGVEIGDEKNRALLNMAQKAGLYRAHMGIESLDPETLRASAKRANLNGTNPAIRYQESFKQLHLRAISSFVAGVIGFDQDTPESVYALRDFMLRSGVSNPIFSILTPYPGTPLWRKLQREGRIFDVDYNNYDMTHLAFDHPNFSKTQIESLYWDCWSWLYYPENIVERLLLNSEWIKGRKPSQADTAALVRQLGNVFNDNLLDDSDLVPLADANEARTNLARDIRSNFRTLKRLDRRLHPQLVY